MIVQLRSALKNQGHARKKSKLHKEENCTTSPSRRMVLCVREWRGMSQKRQFKPSIAGYRCPMAAVRKELIFRQTLHIPHHLTLPL